jgi:hypothetical protein
MIARAIPSVLESSVAGKLGQARPLCDYELLIERLVTSIRVVAGIAVARDKHFGEVRSVDASVVSGFVACDVSGTEVEG